MKTHLACIVITALFLTAVQGREYTEYRLQIHAGRVTKEDNYQCVSTSLEDILGQYVAGYSVYANVDNVHHLAFSFCGQYNSNTTTWDCYKNQGNVCRGSTKDIAGYNAEGMGHNNMTYMFPEDVGIKIGVEEGFYNFVTQFHLKKPTSGPSEPVYVTLFLVDSASMRYNTFATVQSGYIPAHTRGFSAETACKWTGVEIFPYSFGTHTHERGFFVEGYRIRNGTWAVIGQGDNHIENGAITTGSEAEVFNIAPGDVIASRCLFNNDEERDVHMGLKHSNEMCVFTIKFKYRPEDELVYYRAPICQTDIQAFNWCSLEETRDRCGKQ